MSHEIDKLLSANVIRPITRDEVKYVSSIFLGPKWDGSYRLILNLKNLQSNLDYSKCQGPQESFRIIGSSNDQKWEFSDIFGKARMLSKKVIVLPEFATSAHAFREVIGTYAKALKKMSSLEVVASSSLMLCRSKNAEN